MLHWGGLYVCAPWAICYFTNNVQEALTFVKVYAEFLLEIKRTETPVVTGKMYAAAPYGARIKCWWRTRTWATDNCLHIFIVAKSLDVGP